MTSDNDPRSEKLNAIIAEYLQAVETGRASRDELLARHPRLTDELQAFLDQHDQLQQVAPVSPAPPSEDATIPPADEPSEEATLAPGDGTVEIGTRVPYFGDYELLEEIARGGMGVVYKARQVSLNRIVALKMILAGQLASQEDVQRFHAEAEAAANLDHPGIVPIHEVGVHGGQHYFSMGFVEGQSLAAKIVDGPLPPREAAEVTKPVAEAVAYAHDHGVIHRDLKPANVLLDENEHPRITDFGLAKRVQGDSDMTRSGQILGTPSYMPPEQASGKIDAIKETADVYALGAILYCLLTGRPPFQADNQLDTLLQVLEQEPVSPRVLNPKIPKDLETICVKCLEKKHHQRYTSAQALVEELGRFLSSEPILARPISGPARAWRWCKRKPAIAGSIAAIVVTVIVVAMVMGIQKRQNDRARAKSLVEALSNARGVVLPYAIKDLKDFPRRLVLDELREQFSASDDVRKLPLAYALADYGQVERDFLIGAIPNVIGEECNNLANSLESESASALPELKDLAAEATANEEWDLKTRYAVIAMYLGDTSIAAEMLRGEPDEPQRILSPLETLREQLAAIAKMPTEQQNDPQIRLQRATANYYLDRTQDALLDLDELVAADSVPSQALLLRALCLAREGKEEEAAEAVKKFTEAVKDERYASYAASGRILSQAWLGNTDQAQRQLDELVAQGQDDALTQYNGACIAAQLARIQVDANPEETTRLKQRSLDLLRRAYTELGYKGSSGIDNDPNLAPLYDDPEFQAFVFELKPAVQEFDPAQRTAFIKEFPAWCGAIERLVGLLQNTNNGHLRSGICLAIGGLERPSATAKEAWDKVLTQWYQSASDSGTHSAAGWALRQWSLPVPQGLVGKDPSPSRSWWHPSDDLVMLRIPSGHFGKEIRGGRPESVRVNEFWLSDREIAVGLFRQFTNDKEYVEKFPEEVPSDWSGEDEKRSPGSDHPVQKVSWYDAVMFCNWLNRKEGLDPCYEKKGKEKVRDSDSNTREYLAWQLVPGANGYRLPTEDEWEHACRAGTTTKFCFGDNESQLADYDWYNVNSESRTHAWGGKLCNAWGLFDMHGNVREWCQDIFRDSNWVSRAVRGGHWSNNARMCLSSLRGRFGPTLRSNDVGFRVARGPFASKSAGGAESDARK